jgi:hypothetical protein
MINREPSAKANEVAEPVKAVLFKVRLRPWYRRVLVVAPETATTLRAELFAPSKVRVSEPLKASAWSAEIVDQVYAVTGLSLRMQVGRRAVAASGGKLIRRELVPNLYQSDSAKLVHDTAGELR